MVHTRDDVVIRFGRSASVSKDYIEFLATMTELYERGQVGEGEERITLQEGLPLQALLRSERLDAVIVMSPVGKKENLGQILSRLGEKEIGIVIGGFPEGDYLSPVYELADLVVSLGDEILTVPDVTAQVLIAIP